MWCSSPEKFQGFLIPLKSKAGLWKSSCLISSSVFIPFLSTSIILNWFRKEASSLVSSVLSKARSASCFRWLYFTNSHMFARTDISKGISKASPPSLAHRCDNSPCNSSGCQWERWGNQKVDMLATQIRGLLHCKFFLLLLISSSNGMHSELLSGVLVAISLL